LGQKTQFTAAQLMAMFLTKIKQTAATELKTEVSDIVISCPAWYTDAQRRGMIDSADISGLKLLRLINESTAAALGYGITKLDLPTAEEKPRRVAFVDVGHSNYTVSIVEFIKGQLTVKATAWDRHFGGRNIDKALVDHFAEEFKEKFKIDITQNPKARVRVAAACEKLKKVLSANASAPLNIESLMNDVDVRSFLKREELEELIKPLLDRMTVPLQQALNDAKLKVEDIDTIEMVGGSTRVPSVKAAVQEFFGKPLSFTLNQDEAIARGCAFACAILSPAFRVRDFSVHDIVNYPIQFTWEKSADIPDEDTSLTVFNKGNTMPSTKILTFYRKQNFDLEARYAKPEELPGKTAPWIGKFSVKSVKPDAKDDFMICKLKARVNLHGVLNVEQGYYVEEQEVEEPIPEKEGEKKEGDVRTDSAFVSPANLNGQPTQAEVDVNAALNTAARGSRAIPPPEQPNVKRHRKSLGDKSEPEIVPPSVPVSSIISTQDSMLTSQSQSMETDEKPKTRKVKKQVRRGDLPLAAATSGLDPKEKEAATEKEQQMIMEDKLVADTEDKKNELESFIYDLRNKIDEQYAEFANDEEKEKVRRKCEETEEWLYDEGEDSKKAVYVAKIEELRASAGPIIQRYLDKIEEERQSRMVKEQEEASRRHAAAAAKKRAEDDKRAAEEASKKPAEPAEDTEMKDAAETAESEEVS
jgi:heat shock protein 4